MSTWTLFDSPTGPPPAPPAAPPSQPLMPPAAPAGNANPAPITAPITADLNQETVIIALTIRRPGNSKKLTASQVAVRARQTSFDDIELGAADPDMLHVGKTLLESEELQRIIQRQNALRRWLCNRALPSPVLKAGCYRLPVSLIADVDAHLQEEASAINHLIETDFMPSYPALKLIARGKLKELYHEDDYPEPEAIRKAFSITWAYLTLGTPTGKLAMISAALAARERDKAAASIRQEAEAIRDALRIEFRDLVDRMADRLTPGTDGKPKIFRDTLVSGMEQWLDLFAARNVTGDADLAELAKRAKSLLSGVDPQQLRDRDGLRATVAAGFSAIKDGLGSFVAAKPSRKISLEGEV